MTDIYKSIHTHGYCIFQHSLMRFASISHLVVVLPLSLTFLNAGAGAQALGEIEAMGSAYVQTKQPAYNNARFTIYRPLGDVGLPSVSVYLDARYHASLLPGGFTEFCVKLLPIEIGARAIEASDGKRGPLSVVKLTPQAGLQHFLSMTAQPLKALEPSGRGVLLHAKSREEAEVDLAQTREQIHTLSRASVVVSCEDAPAAQAAVVITPIPNSDSVAPSMASVASNVASTASSPASVAPSADSLAQSSTSAASSPISPKPQVITLKTDDLFQVDKAGQYNISPSGRSALNVVIARIKSEYERIDSIKVFGHRAPLGKPELKQINPLERSETVRDYFLANGLKSIRVVSEVRSDPELSDTNCDAVKTKASILCNGSNRRVAIEIMGARSKSR